jgi:hypothetical protein
MAKNISMNADQLRMMYQANKFLDGLISDRFPSPLRYEFDAAVTPLGQDLLIVLCIELATNGTHVIRIKLGRHSSTSSVYHACQSMVKAMASSIDRFPVKADYPHESDVGQDEWTHQQDEFEGESEEAREYDENYLSGDPDRLDDIDLDILFDEDPKNDELGNHRGGGHPGG